MANNYEKSEKEERVKKKTLVTGIICKREQGTLAIWKFQNSEFSLFLMTFFISQNISCQKELTI